MIIIIKREAKSREKMGGNEWQVNQNRKLCTLVLKDEPETQMERQRKQKSSFCRGDVRVMMSVGH